MHLSVGQRVRFTGRDESPDNDGRSTIRPEEIWEGIVIAVDECLVTIRVDVLNGMRTDAVKTVHPERVLWK